MKLLKYSFLIFLVAFASCSGDDEGGWTKLDEKNSPEARYDACSFYNPDSDSFYIIGGRSSQNKKYNDIHTFDIRNKKWIKLNPSGIVLDKGGRMNYCVYDYENHFAYLYGRNAGGNSMPSNIVKYDLVNNRLTEIAASNIPDTSLRGHSVVLLKSGLGEPSLVIFGGENAGNTKNNDIRVFSLISKEFKKLEVSGEKPKARVFHTAVVTLNNKMLIIGGDSSSGVLNDIWSFDFSSEKWKKIASDIPLSSYYVSSFYSKKLNKIFFYGGKNSDKITSDFLVYDIDSNKWEVPDKSPKPGKLSGASLIGSDNGDIFIFGGNYINEKNESVSVNLLYKYGYAR